MAQAQPGATVPEAIPAVERIHAGIPGRDPHAIGYREALALLAIHRRDVPGIDAAVDYAIEQYQDVHGGAP